MAIIPSWETKKKILLFWTTWMELEGISVLSRFSCVQLFVTCQAPLSMGFSRQEYWSRLPGPPPGDLPDPEIEAVSLVSPALQAGSLPTKPLGEHLRTMRDPWKRSTGIGSAPQQSDTCVCPLPRSLHAAPAVALPVSTLALLPSPGLPASVCPAPSTPLPRAMPPSPRQSSLHTLSSWITPPETGEQTLLLVLIAFYIPHLLMFDGAGSSLLCTGSL